ncbi:TraR/DksA C4-type zinc finger protein [uncultured Pluralibacter sp.]|uniref:TraR/DksA C4-type zinc finger protein n=1 Tax=uncultured Pluralibacter sp. TaxID=1490864 RepID=UPI002633277B|nr:TraR/DksA C4-type zinc finger protein [uncultured Pluralibacter sp.]
MKKLSAEEKKAILAMPPEAYMNEEQQAFFLQLLKEERATLLEHIEELKEQLQPANETGDEGDIASREEHLRMLLRQIDRESRLLPKFDAALLRLRNGDYGYCMESGEPIGLERLMLRPTAELSFDAKIKQEMKEGHFRK